MKKTVLNFLLPTAIFGLLLVTGCSKSDNNHNNNTTTTPVSPSFNYSDADGVLAAVNTSTIYNVPFVGPQNIEIGTAVAAFFSTRGGSTYLDAGTITVNDDNTLTKQSGNSYVFQPTTTSYQGIDYSGNSVKWNVSGSGSVSAITNSSFSGFPSDPVITSDSVVTIANGYTFTINHVSNADSIIFILASGSKSAEKRTGGSATTVTFSANELSALSAGSGLLQVTPYHLNKNTSVIPGKNIYFVNESNLNIIGTFK